MINILIVDDDLLLRTNMKLLIDWEQFGFILCGEASNGFEAINIIEKVNPHIIISDIRMPIMDGLQLSAEVNNLYPDIKMIMLSNYDDFDYVRCALKNGAVDYILKHTLNNKEILLEALNRAKKLLENKNLSKPRESLSMNNILALKEKFIIQLLAGFYRNDDEILYNIKSLEIKIETRGILPVIMSVDNYKSITSKGNLNDFCLLEFAIVNITEEILIDHENGVVCHISNDRFIILLSFSNCRNTAIIDSTVDSLLNRIAVCLKKFMNISVSFSIGKMCGSLSNISKSYENAFKALDDKFFAGKNCVLKTNKTNSSDNTLFSLDIKSERQILSFIKAKDWDALMKKLEELFYCIKNLKLSAINSQLVFNDFLGIINKVCKENSIDLSMIYSTDIPPHEHLASLETFEEIINWISTLYKRLITLLMSDSNEPNSEYVKKAINYIRKHYCENISLTDVAHEVNITSVYLSKLFKEEMGVGFSEYICDLRLSKAKAFIEVGNTKIKDIITICGFNNYAYFFNTFKKKFGISPNEFVNGLQSKK